MYDYAAGKLDWLAMGLPSEGTNAEQPRAGDGAQTDVPTCGLDDNMNDVRERVRAAGWDQCVVVSEDRVVIGALRAKALEDDQDCTVEDAMRPGPSTFRPHVSLKEMATYMAEHDMESSIITTADGRLVGVLMRDEVARNR